MRIRGAERIGGAVEFLAGVREFVGDGEELPLPIEAIADPHLLPTDHSRRAT